MDEKRCRKCGETKSLELFSRDRSRPDGRRNACKECDKAHDANPVFQQRRAEYNRTEAGKAAFRKYRRTESGKAHNQARYERLKDTPEYRRRMVAYVTKYFKTEKGQRNIERRRANPQRKAYEREWLARPGSRELVRAWTRAHMQRRLAIRKSLPATLTLEQWRAAVEYFGGCCAYCGRNDLALVQEHFIPLRRMGPYTALNIVPSCRPCNTRKMTRMPEKWCTPAVYARIIAYFASLPQELPR